MTATNNSINLFFTLLLISSILSAPIARPHLTPRPAAATGFQPYPWLRKGAYFVYDVRYEQISTSKYLVRWEVLGVRGDVAVVRVTLLNTSASAVAEVRLSTREVLVGGRVFGVTYMFFERLPSREGEIKFLAYYRGRVIEALARVTGVSSAGYKSTPYGRQRAYLVVAINPIILDLIYDFDTGILLEGLWEAGYEEAFLKLVGLGHMGYCRLLKTNVDLGPVDVFYELMRFVVDNLPLILFAVALAVSLAIMRRRARRREGAQPY